MATESFKSRDAMGREYWIERERVEESDVEQLTDYELDSRWRAFNPEPEPADAMEVLQATLARCAEMDKAK